MERGKGFCISQVIWAVFIYYMLHLERIVVSFCILCHSSLEVVWISNSARGRLNHLFFIVFGMQNPTSADTAVTGY